MTSTQDSLVRQFGLRRLLAFTLALQSSTSVLLAEDWPQFRGVNGAGVALSDQSLPVQVSTENLLVWKSSVPGGHSSPVIAGDRIYLTAVDKERLLTVALSRNTGEVLWTAEAPYEKAEEIHRTGSLAQSSPATDGDIVVSFFGSSGLHAYDRNGNRLWSHRMGPFHNDFGAGSSPIIREDRVILVQDHDIDSFITVYDKKTGEELWRKERPEFLRNYATPVIWTVNGRPQIVVAATLRVVGYDLETGEELWTVKGLSRIINMTPVIGDDNTLYVSCFSPGNEGEERVTPLAPDELFASDSDQNGTIEETEFPEHPFKRRFSQLDRDKNGHLTRAEYEVASRPHTEGRNVVVAIAPGGSGDITKTHVRWEYQKQIPYCPSPLYYRGALYMVKNGGILSVLNADTGELLQQKRLKATGDYYASPVGGDGKVYLLNVNGELTVLSADDWSELHTVNFDGDGHSTPAIADGKLYVRIADRLYCFGTTDQNLSQRTTD